MLRPMPADPVPESRSAHAHRHLRRNFCLPRRLARDRAQPARGRPAARPVVPSSTSCRNRGAGWSPTPPTAPAHPEDYVAQAFAVGRGRPLCGRACAQATFAPGPRLLVLVGRRWSARRPAAGRLRVGNHSPAVFATRRGSCWQRDGGALARTANRRRCVRGAGRGPESQSRGRFIVARRSVGSGSPAWPRQDQGGWPRLALDAWFARAPAACDQRLAVSIVGSLHAERLGAALLDAATTGLAARFAWPSPSPWRRLAEAKAGARRRGRP